MLPSPANPIARATLWQLHDVEIVLVRHGQQIPLDERRDDQITDPPLTDIGERQIEAVAEHLAGEEIAAVYSSTLERAHRTGEAIAARHGLEVTTVHEIREIEVLRRERAGASMPPRSTRSSGAAAASDSSTPGRWDSFPRAEASDDFRRRIARGIEGIVARHPEGKVVIACHGGVINAYVAEILGHRPRLLLPGDALFGASRARRTRAAGGVEPQRDAPPHRRAAHRCMTLFHLVSGADWDAMVDRRGVPATVARRRGVRAPVGTGAGGSHPPALLCRRCPTC